MMMQNNYGWLSQAGVPGGLVDSSPKSVISRANGGSAPIRPGYGVVRGEDPGATVALPTAASTASVFEGVVAAGIAEHDAKGGVYNNPTKVLGLLEWGKIWVRVVDGLSINYGDPLFLVNTGSGAGKFTNVSTGALRLNGMFIGAVDSADIAPVRLYNAPHA